MTSRNPVTTRAAASTCVPAMLAALTLAIPALATPARAADPAPAPIQGASVMGDKGRSGPDGWVQAPITRDQAPGARPAGGGDAAAPNKQPDPQASRTLPPGQDPGTPATATLAGPGTVNTSAGDRKP